MPTTPSKKVRNNDITPTSEPSPLLQCLEPQPPSSPRTCVDSMLSDTPCARDVMTAQPAESSHSDQTSQDTTLSSMAIGDVVDIADMVDNVDTDNTIVSTHTDNTDNTSAHNKQTLPSGCNLKQDTVISILTNAEPLQHIPPSTKENCYFLVDNKLNKIRRDQGRHSEFPDDCGAWATGAPSSQTHLLARQHGFSVVIKRANLFCTRRQINKKMTYTH